ncbi:MAG: L,D-transpeptidase [Flavobacteriaceae bacterium]
MKPISILVTGALAALISHGALADDPAPAPQGAYRVAANGDMPFPRLMDSIFGARQAQPARQPRAAYGGQPAYGQPAYGAPRWQQQARQPRRDEPRHNEPRGVSAKPAPVAVATAANRQFDPKFAKQEVAYGGGETPGTVIIDTNERFLYLVEDNGRALRYGVGVGRPGFEWAGTHKVTRKAEWPDWRPPAEMRQRQPYLPEMMPGGPKNPLGARALYLGSTLYRIHGSNEPWTIGHAVSSGCIRMRNEDVIDLYERVPVGATVKVI